MIKTVFNNKVHMELASCHEFEMQLYRKINPHNKTDNMLLKEPKRNEMHERCITERKRGRDIECVTKKCGLWHFGLAQPQMTYQIQLASSAADDDVCHQ